jgi:hypothetical protein
MVEMYACAVVLLAGLTLMAWVLCKSAARKVRR